MDQPDQLKAQYLAARPFPHLIIDDLFPAAWLLGILKECHEDRNLRWKSFDTALQKKRGTEPDSDFPPYLQRYFDFVNSGPFLRLLTRLTGIESLLPDPTLYGGGLHVVSGQGFFDLHVDFQHHPRTLLTNRLAIITYLNEEWDQACGGNLELWEIAPARRAVEIIPHFGRTVLMAQSAIAAHGHPTPILPGRERIAVIAYFYTSDPATLRIDRRRTSTLYVPRTGRSANARLQAALHNVLPQPIIRGLRTVRHSLRAPRRSSKR
ncbi:2OG-Fe(II) oxygenase [Gluconacetobacter takamatsuzukensis]|nr:2OG-Fe(II) oxygenase [Gluconacetobacter takamatsuzukensis]